MPFQPTTDGCKIVTQIGSQIVNFSNVLWFSKVGFDQANMLALVNDVKDNYDDILKEHMSDVVSLRTFQAYDMRSLEGVIVDDTRGTIVCTNAGQKMPTSNSVLLTLRTGLRGRSYRGRLYLAGFTESHIVDGAWQSVVIDAAELFGETMITSAQTLGWTFGVRSGQVDEVVRESGLITAINTVEVRSGQPGTQRRRIFRN